MGICSYLRKFGLGYCDLPTMLWNIKVLLRPLLLNIDSQDKDGIHIIFYIFFLIMMVGFVYVFIFSGLWFVLIRSEELGLTAYRMVVLSLVISTEMGPVKLFWVIFNRVATRKLVDGYLECNSQVEPNSRFENNLLDNMRKVKKRAVIYWMVVVGNGFFFCMRPLSHPTKRTAIDENYPLYGLEPVLESPKYELNILAMSLAVTFTCYPPANISALIICLVGYSESQLLALSAELRSIWKDADEYYANVMNNPGPTGVDEKLKKNMFVRQKLRMIKNFHVKNIEFIKETERLFKNAFAGQLLILMASLITELLGGLEYTYIQIPFAFVQVAIDCLAGQKLIDAGQVFEQALFDSKWEEFDMVNRKAILLMLANSQKTLQVSAGGVSILNFELLMRIIRCVYSAYTALHSKT